MQFTDNEIILISELLIKILNNYIKQRVKLDDEIISSFSEIVETTNPEIVVISDSEIVVTPNVKRKRGRPNKSFQKIV